MRWALEWSGDTARVAGPMSSAGGGQVETSTHTPFSPTQVAREKSSASRARQTRVGAQICCFLAVGGPRS